MSDSAGRSVAIVGSGPGGIYVAQALIEKAPGVHIDIIDRLPTPFGLVRGGVAPERISALAERFEIDLGRRYENLSHGNKQKVALIQAFMHEPELLILDEPTMGLDPLMQREFHLLVQESVARGATVFLSSHVLSEVELICDRIGLIRDGRLLRVGSLADFRSLRIHRVEAVVTGHLTAADLAHIPGVTEPKVEDHLATCAIRGSVAPLLASLSAAGVTELDSHELSLEEVFLAEFEGPPQAQADH